MHEVLQVRLVLYSNRFYSSEYIEFPPVRPSHLQCPLRWTVPFSPVRILTQGSATPSECAFSSGGTTGTAKRNRLKPDAFEALQLLKSAYRNRHLAADKEACKHVFSFVESDDEMPDLV